MTTVNSSSLHGACTLALSQMRRLSSSQSCMFVVLKRHSSLVCASYLVRIRLVRSKIRTCHLSPHVGEAMVAVLMRMTL